MQDLQQLVDPLHIEDLRNGSHPSFFDENEAYDMLIVRLPVLNKGFETHSSGFILTPEKSYMYDPDENRFEELMSRFEGPYTILDKLIDRLLRSFGKYQDAIADMEESLYADKMTEDFMTRWLGLKQDIVRIERILLRTSQTLQEMIDHYEGLEGFPINNYIDLHEHIERIQRSSTLQLSKLDYVYSFYNTRTNEKMNRLIYLLTIISAIFLPLNLLVGFFGMNTTGLPFTQEGGYGTFGAVTLMSCMVILTTIGVYVWRRNVER